MNLTKLATFSLALASGSLVRLTRTNAKNEKERNHCGIFSTTRTNTAGKEFSISIPIVLYFIVKMSKMKSTARIYCNLYRTVKAKTT